MEVDDESSVPQQTNSCNASDGELWKILNELLVSIIADPGHSEETLQSLLDAILEKLVNMRNIWVPPMVHGETYKNIRHRYTVFTTWLFGAMFSMLGAPFSEKVHEVSVEVQARLLRIFSCDHPVTFDLMSSEYITILDELQEFYEEHCEDDHLVVSKFRVEVEAIDYLNLTPFPVEIKHTAVSSTQVSLLKVIVKSGVTAWKQPELWDRVLRMLANSSLDVKLIALEVATELLTFSMVDEEKLTILIAYMTEMVRTVSSWQSTGLLSEHSLPQFSERIMELLKALHASSIVTDLCFQIVDLVVFNSFTGSGELGNAACRKIREFLKDNPKSCESHEIEKYLEYFKIWPDIISVLQHFVLNDIMSSSSDNETVVVVEVSELWSKLRENLAPDLNCEQLDRRLYLLRCSYWIDSTLADKGISARFYNEHLDPVDMKMMENRGETAREYAKLLCENMAYFISHREVKCEKVEQILALLLARNVTLPFRFNTNVAALSELMDIATRMKCLAALCEFGKGQWRLKLLRSCMMDRGEVELASACVSNSVLLMQDHEMEPTRLIKNIWMPALVSQKQHLLEALPDALGSMVCLVSGEAAVVRESWDSTKSVIKCTKCDKAKNLRVANKRNDMADVENFLGPFFELLTSGSDNVRIRMSANFHRFSNHTRLFNAEGTLEKLLPYIHDANFEIRMNASKVLGVALKNKLALEQELGTCSADNRSPSIESFIDSVFEIINKYVGDAVDDRNPQLHETLLIAAKELACVPIHLVERTTSNVFLFTILHPGSSAVAVASAKVAYEEVAAFHGVTPKTMYTRYKRAFLKLMMQMAVRNRIYYSYNLATAIHRFAMCVGFQGSRQLLRKDGHLALCYLIEFVAKNPEAESLFDDMAESIAMDKKQMIVEYFQYILPYVVVELDEKVGRDYIQLLKKLTNESIPVLIEKSFMGIFSEMFLYFHSHTSEVIQYIGKLARWDTEYRGSFDNRENVALYLKPRLLGVLVRLDSNLSPRCDEFAQKSALASLESLMCFMGPKYVTPLRYKVLTTLRTSLAFERPGFRQLACMAWDAFLHNVSMEDLGPLLPTIFVSLTPLLESCPTETNAMLEFLIVENRNGVANNMSELFFINDLKVSEKIAVIVRRQIEQSRPESFEENLSLWLKRIVHETDEVRHKALTYLQKFLADHRSELNEMVLSDSDVHPLIVELLDTLLAGCRDKDVNIRLAYGECLGELGAVEPSLLPRRIVSRAESKFILDMNEDFACAALGEFVRTFQTQRNTQSMDCFSLAIQEILRTYGISPQGTNSRLWDGLPLYMREMIFPLLTSHYKVTASNEKNQFPRPIYGSATGSTFDMWAYNWVCAMSSSIRDTKLSAFINACLPAFKRDMKTLIFCIPQIVSHIVVNGSETDRNKLVDEMLAVINVSEQTSLDEELLRRIPLRSSQTTSTATRVSDEDKRLRCSQVVFSILDHLQRWLRERRLSKDEKYHLMKGFCERFNSLVLAEGCYKSHEYHRALIYLEQHMASSEKVLAESTESGLLAKIYAQLEEPDGVSGIMAMQDQSPTLQQLVLAHEVSGQLQDAAMCYERLAQEKVLEPKYLQGMVQCYLGLDQPFTARNIIGGVLNNRPELEPLMVDHESFWRLSDFSQLDNPVLKTVKRSLLDDLENGVRPNLQSLKTRIVNLLGAASPQGAYQQSYSHIMKLHILNEFEKAASIMLQDPENLPTIFDEWEKRSQLVRASRGVEFVLSMRRAILSLAAQLQKSTAGNLNSVLNEEIVKIWLKSAKIARKAGLYQQAYMYILSANSGNPPPELYIEQAQLYWQKGCQEDAFTTLKRCFANCFQPSAHYKLMPSGVRTDERRQCAKAKLLFAKYNDETVNVDTDGNIANYKEAIEVWRVWEKSLLSCAQYYERIVDRMADEERDTKGRDLQVHMMNYYGKSLQCGCKYVHQSLPRMLTIWIDFASRVQSSSKSRSDTLAKMTKIMEVYLERLPTFLWLTAFSQLVSRICHPSREVQNTLCSILVKLILAYPQHCLWMMASVFKSSYPVRQKRCQEILNHARLKTPTIVKLVQDFNRLWERLIELSNKTISENTTTTTVQSLSRHLPRMLSAPDFSNIMMPTTKFRQLHLPPKGDTAGEHDPFPMHTAHIVGIEDNVMVMASLQKPRRITLKGSDGGRYLFMCKPKDDLRRDFRLMEFNDIVNKFLQKDPESRQRRLYIRTYSVAPLNEECGLIEWVPNLVGFRPIVMDLYKEKGLAIPGKELKTMICGLNDKLEKKKQIFLEKLLPRHPPVLSEWFRLSFPDAYGWYEARTAYIRTTAVMSMVGYILGLGDRHGENILFDSKCGDCVHVDFNCLFNRGESFDWPERVPFRLTQNMVEAMGPLKLEGPFKKSCQTTMRVLREQSTTLLSVLTPFVYDPLVSWNRNESESGEKTNEKAVENIKNIKQRLKGLLRTQEKKVTNYALNLSVEGQTNHLILEATNVDNLCQMYLGWGPYL